VACARSTNFGHGLICSWLGSCRVVSGRVRLGLEYINHSVSQTTHIIMLRQPCITNNTTRRRSPEHKVYEEGRVALDRCDGRVWRDGILSTQIEAFGERGNFHSGIHDNSFCHTTCIRIVQTICYDITPVCQSVCYMPVKMRAEFRYTLNAHLSFSD